MLPLNDWSSDSLFLWRSITQSLSLDPEAEGQERKGERNGRQANEQMGNCMKKERSWWRRGRRDWMRMLYDEGSRKSNRRDDESQKEGGCRAKQWFTNLF